jgi:hypothetical protein
MTVHNDHLLVNDDHVLVHVEAIQRESERLTLTQPGSRAEQDEQRVPRRHGGGSARTWAGARSRTVVLLTSGSRISVHGVLRM